MWLNEYLDLLHPGYVYLIRQDDYVKIGYTAQPPYRRLTNLQVGNPHPLSLFAYIVAGPETETLLHQRLSEAHVRGEWFHLPGARLDDLLDLLGRLGFLIVQ